MATRIELLEVLIPLQTLSTAPADFPLQFPEGVVDNLEILIPPGPSGLVGFQVLHGDQQVIPLTRGVFIITDNETLDWPLSGYPVGHAWAVRAFNNDRYDHTLYFRFLITDTGPVTGATVTPVEIPLGSAAPEQVAEVEALPEATLEEIEALQDEQVSV